VLAPGEEGGAYVRWLESRGQGRHANMVLAAAPIEGGQTLTDPFRVTIDVSELLALRAAQLRAAA